MAFFRRRAAEPDPGPDCQSCGNPTYRPFLYSNPHTHWQCGSCEQKRVDHLIQRLESPSGQ